MAQPAGQLYEFGPFHLDVDERVLRRDDQVVDITPKVFDLLVLLIEHRGKLLDKGRLLEALWPESHVEESNLSVNVSTLRKALGETPGQAAYIETVPKHGYRFVAEVAVKTTGRAATVPHEPSAEPAVGRPRRWVPAAIGLAIVAVSLAWIAWTGRGDQEPRLQSIAVLPFKPLAGSEDEDHLGLGMADALITRLSNIREVTVRPTSAVANYSAPSQDLQAAGQALGVDAILDGRVQYSGTTIRVTVQLVRVSDGRPLWAETFDSTFTNIFAVQDAISEKMTEALSLRLTGEERVRITRRYTQNTAAYRLFLQGQYFALRFSPESAQRAIDFYQQAIALDPGYALPYAGLAASQIMLASYATPANAAAAMDLQRQAMSSATKAIGLDDRLPEAHVALGWVRMHVDWDWAAAERSFRHAIDIQPNHAQALGAHSTLLTVLGRTEEALTQMERAVSLDPTSVVWNESLAWTLYCSRRYDQAAAQSLKVIEMDPASAAAYRQLGRTHLVQGKYSEAIAAFKRTAELSKDGDGGALAYLGRAYALSGSRADAERILTELEENAQTISAAPYSLALLHQALGHTDRAMQSLEEAYRVRSARMQTLKVEPELDELRDDPRFADLLRRMRLLPESRVRSSRFDGATARPRAASESSVGTAVHRGLVAQEQHRPGVARSDRHRAATLAVRLILSRWRMTIVDT